MRTSSFIYPSCHETGLVLVLLFWFDFFGVVFGSFWFVYVADTERANFVLISLDAISNVSQAIIYSCHRDISDSDLID